ncbi:MAG: hypothetical protein LBJ36_12080 [Synergistaceae bacterium]|jgi:hypothetical protein|nr:hypothetical protein [Synergistaceae bacterium]
MEPRWRRAHALSWVVALMFLASVLLGVEAAHLGYSFEVMDIYSKRAEARAELISLTNLASRWLRAELKNGIRPRAKAIEFNENLTDFNLLIIFSADALEKIEGGVQLFDLEYNPENVVEPVADPLSFPPCFPGGYLIRARLAKKGLAPITMESLYVVTPFDILGKGIVYILKEKPLYWRELFR